MKGIRFLLLVMAICLASGVKAQFYDDADDIYYYVEYKDGAFVNNEGVYGKEGRVLVFNFDGKKAATLVAYAKYGGEVRGSVKDYIKNNPAYYEERVENEEYDLNYISNNTYKYKYRLGNGEEEYITYGFSYDREILNFHSHYWKSPNYFGDSCGWVDLHKTYKKVDKSFFKVGRSRTPSGTLHE